MIKWERASVCSCFRNFGAKWLLTSFSPFALLFHFIFACECITVKLFHEDGNIELFPWVTSRKMFFPILTHALKWKKAKGLILFSSCSYYSSCLTKVVIYFSSRWRKHSLKIENTVVWIKESRELGNKGSTV